MQSRREADLVRGDSQLVTPRSRLRSMVKHLPYRWLLGSLRRASLRWPRNGEYLQHYGVEEDRLYFVPHFVDNAFFRDRGRPHVRAGAPRSSTHDRGVDRPSWCVRRKIHKKETRQRFHSGVSGRTPAGLYVTGHRRVRSGQASPCALAREIEAPVTFPGFRNQTELPACLAACDRWRCRRRRNLGTGRQRSDGLRAARAVSRAAAAARTSSSTTGPDRFSRWATFWHLSAR